MNKYTITMFNLRHAVPHMRVNRQLVTGRRLTRSFSADRWGYDRWWGIDSMCTLSFISLSRICTSCCMEGRWPDSSLDHTGTSTTKHREGRNAPLHWQSQKTHRASLNIKCKRSKAMQVGTVLYREKCLGQQCFKPLAVLNPAQLEQRV